MLYAYKCYYCDNTFDVVKHHTESSKPEICPNCTETAERVYTAPQLSGLNEEPEYNPALGCWVKNKNHRKELAKQRGLVEIGNESRESIHKHCEANRKRRDYDA